MRSVEWERLVRLLVRRRHLQPSVFATGLASVRDAERLDNNGTPVAADVAIATAPLLPEPAVVPAGVAPPEINPSSCKEQGVLPKQPDDPENGAGGPVTAPAPVSHRHTQLDPKSSAAADGTSVSGSGSSSGTATKSGSVSPSPTHSGSPSGSGSTSLSPRGTPSPLPPTPWDGKPLGEADAGVDMTFDFGTLIAHLAKTRSLSAGTIIGSGTVSNRDADGGPGRPVSEGGLGYSCIAEVRTVETILRGAPETPFLTHGDTVRIEMLDDHHRSIFGAIEQTVAALPDRS
jgi:hypothetical protein